MSSAVTTPHLKFFDCCPPIASRTAYNLTPSVNKPSCVSFSRNQTHFATAISSSVSLKHRRNKTVSLVAQTSDWAPEKDGSDFESDASDADADSATWDGAEESDGGDEASYPEPPEEAKLFVGNLPYDVDSEKLAQLFNEAGVVEISEVIYNRQTEQSRGFGFVTMSTVEEAEKAVEMFNRYDLNGRLLTVNKASPRGAEPPARAPRNNGYEGSSNRLYVGNLPWQVDDERLEEVFSEHGKVVGAKVVYDRDTGRSRGFGFVTMSSEAESNDAIAALDGQSLDGRAIRVNVAEERPRRGGSF